MKKILVLGAITLSCVVSFSLGAAERVKTTINQIYEPTPEDPDYLLLANDGRVYGIEASDDELAAIAREALAASSPVELELRPLEKHERDNDMRSTVDDIRLVEPATAFEVPYRPEVPESDAFFAPEGHITPMDGFRVSNFSAAGVANLFNSMRADLSSASECYNRAHVWSWEIYQEQRYNTGKMFLFFTRRYINEYRYKWWFHVAPFVSQTGRAEYMVLDRTFSSWAQPMHTWTDMFMRNDAHCPVVDRYSSYSQNQYARYCYLIPASMYYWQPYNLDYLERYHTTKRTFIQGEVNHAYRDAQRRW